MSSQLKKAAKESLSGRWGFAVLTVILFSIIQGVPGLFGSDIDEPANTMDLVVSLVSILLIPVGVGWTWIAMSIARGEETKVTDLFEPYGMFFKVIGLAIVQLFFIFLWLLLLVVPGIIKSFSYMLTFYILRDEPSIGILEAITRSRKMMDGHKMEAFLLLLSFIGWALLGIVTLGLAFLWITPYFSVTFAKFYDRVRGEKTPEPTSDFVAPY
ncbi:hypothetical protein RSA11_08980 [Exiguobacterium indicum]|uniref:DUF975 family protein n=1 Tax=Exiguobacterium indicum TaxID=296995 RepID=A0AAW3MBG5_9BACL|nr:DUF975 family protein [Exiguobacterium indicum]KTR26702.1 hypothetical protein RSA11_08980 [Exiguobacterium indicum]